MGTSVRTQERSWKCVIQRPPACLGPLPQQLEGDKPERPLPAGDVPYGVCRSLAAPLSHPSSGGKWMGANARGGHHGPAADPLLQNLGAQRVLRGMDPSGDGRGETGGQDVL